MRVYLKDTQNKQIILYANIADNSLWKQAQVKIFWLEKKKTQISIEFRNKPGDGEGGYGVGV